MAILPDVFNSNDHKGFEPVPAGWYEAVISKSEIKKAKSGNNYLALTFKIEGGEHDKRLVFNNLNMWHPNKQAAEIAQREFAAICSACGVEAVEDTMDLHNIPIGVMLTIEEQPGWPPSNRIKRVSSINDIPEDDSNPF